MRLSTYNHLPNLSFAKVLSSWGRAAGVRRSDISWLAFGHAIADHKALFALDLGRVTNKTFIACGKDRLVRLYFVRWLT
jgi:hypothetical protein